MLQEMETNVKQKEIEAKIKVQEILGIERRIGALYLIDSRVSGRVGKLSNSEREVVVGVLVDRENSNFREDGASGEAGEAGVDSCFF